MSRFEDFSPAERHALLRALEKLGVCSTLSLRGTLPDFLYWELHAAQYPPAPPQVAVSTLTGAPNAGHLLPPASTRARPGGRE